jgi:hypothetical protein
MQFLYSNHILIIVLVSFFMVMIAFRMIGIERIAHTVTRLPKLAMILSCIFIALLGIGAGNLRVDVDLKSVMPSTVPCDIATKKIDKLFGGVESVFISIESKKGTIWNPVVLGKVQAISRDLKAARYVDSVVSISEAKDAVLEDDTLITRNFMEQIPRTSAEMDDLIKRVKNNKLLGGKLVSADDTVTLVMANVRQNIFIISNGQQVSIRVDDSEICGRDAKHPDKPTLENLKAKYEDNNVKISLSGYTYLRYDTFGKTVVEMMLFMIFGIVIMLGILFFFFRSKRGMLLPFLVVILSMIGLYGFIGWMKEVLILPYVIIPPMFIAIAHNYGTQLIANYYEDIQQDLGKNTMNHLAKSGIIKMSTPIMLSVITVIIGFLAMYGHPLKSIAYLGFFSAFGIILAFVLTIVLTPAILSLLKMPSHLLKEKHGTRTDRLLGKTASFVTRYRIALLGATAAVLVLFAILIPRIDVDNNMVEYYKKNNPVRQTFEMLGKKFSGAASINLLIESGNPVSPDSSDDGPMKSPEMLSWMERLEKFAKSLTNAATGKPLIGDAYSLADQVAYLNSVMQDDVSKDVVPNDKNLIAQYLLLFEGAGGGKDLSSLVDFKYNNAQIIIQLPEMNTRKVQVVIDAVKDFIKKDPPPDAAASFGGTIMYSQELSPLLIQGQVHSILLSIAVIILCYMVIFRSVSAGLISAVPLIIAILSVFGCMSLFHIKLDMVTVILSSIMIGAGTDYTAYFLWRMREMTQKYGNLEEAYRATMTTIGKGILFNGLSVVIGFVVLLFSHFQPVIYFGFLIALSIMICIIAALTIMPAVILIVKPKFLFRKAGDTHRSRII